MSREAAEIVSRGDAQRGRFKQIIPSAIWAAVIGRLRAKGGKSFHRATLTISLALGASCSTPVESKRVVYHVHYPDKEVYSTYCVVGQEERLIERETFDHNGALLLTELFQQQDRLQCPERLGEPVSDEP